MPKIDTSKIENYATMTAEERLAALEAYEYEAAGVDVDAYKRAVNKANAEAAEWKNKHRALLSEEERKEAERLENQKKLEEELNNLRNETTVYKTKARLTADGYDAELAEETARAFAEGNLEKILANQKIHIEKVKKAERASALAGDPKPHAGSSGGAKTTKEQFDAMGYSERLKLHNEQPELYKQFTGGTE